MKKYMLLCTVFLVLMLCLCSCSKEEAVTKEPEKKVDMNALLDNVTKAAGTLPDMTKFTSSDEDAESTFSYLCDLDYSKVSSFVISYASEATAEEIFIIELKDSGDMSAAKLALRKRIKTRRTAFNTYLPAEVSKVDKAKITYSGRTIALLICSDNKSADDAFQAYFEK